MKENGPEGLQKKPDASEIEPLIRYVQVLANCYPTPISQKQLARKAKVSLPAVSKIRERLQSICEPRLGFQRKLVLRRDATTVSVLFETFFSAGEIAPLLESGYGKSLWRTWVLDIHKQIYKTVPEYAKFFNDDEALFVADLLVRALIDSIGRFDFSRIDRWDSEGVQYALVMQVVNVVNKIGKNLRRQLKDHDSLERILAIRDRAWFMCMELVKNRLGGVFSEVLSSLSDGTTRDRYLEVYIETATFYLKHRIFDYFNEQIRKAAASAGIEFPQSYIEVGRFFDPEREKRDPDCSGPRSRSSSIFNQTGKSGHEIHRTKGIDQLELGHRR